MATSSPFCYDSTGIVQQIYVLFYAKMGHRPIKTTRKNLTVKSTVKHDGNPKSMMSKAFAQNGDITLRQNWQKQQRTQNAGMKHSLLQKL